MQNKVIRRSKIKLINKDTGNLDEVISEESIPVGAVYDKNMISCEIHNRGQEDILFRNMIYPNGPQVILCLRDGFCHLPHQYYTGETKSGAPLEILKNYGSTKFKGNKLPSRPEGIMI